MTIYLPNQLSLLFSAVLRFAYGIVEKQECDDQNMRVIYK